MALSILSARMVLTASRAMLHNADRVEPRGHADGAGTARSDERPVAGRALDAGVPAGHAPVRREAHADQHAARAGGAQGERRGADPVDVRAAVRAGQAAGVLDLVDAPVAVLVDEPQERRARPDELRLLLGVRVERDVGQGDVPHAVVAQPVAVALARELLALAEER